MLVRHRLQSFVMMALAIVGACLLDDVLGSGISLYVSQGMFASDANDCLSPIGKPANTPASKVRPARGA